MKVDGFDADIRIKGVLVEENRTASKVGHMKAFMKDFVFDIVRCFLKGNEVPLSCNLFLEGTFFSTSGPRVPVVDAESPLHN